MGKESPLVTTEQLVEKLREVLENWPLYREFRYYGTTWGFVPAEIELYCESTECQKPQLWKTYLNLTSGMNREGSPQKVSFFEKEYKCKNCEKRVARVHC